MAVKIDKEFLIKHNFWILTGTFLIIALIPLMIMGASVGDTIAKEQSDLDAQKKTAQGIKDPKNQNWVNAAMKQDGYVVAKRDEVWAASWKTQQDMMTWPDAMEEQYQFSKKYKYIGDDIDIFEREIFKRHYASQLPALYEIVQPLDLKTGEGVTQFLGGSPQAVLKLDRSWQNVPTKEDIWLAQEDVWLAREVLHIIRNANDSVAIFKEVGENPVAPAEAKPSGDAKDPKAASPVADKASKDALSPDAKAAKPAPAPAPKTDPYHKVLRNAYWEMDLGISKDDKGKHFLNGKITNISKQRQPLGVFKIYLEESKQEFATLPIDKEPQAPKASIEIKNMEIPSGLTIRGIFGVEQVLNWRTAPVKRVDQIQMGYNSSRTSRKTLKPPSWMLKDEPAAAADANAAPSMGSMGGGNKFQNLMASGGPGGIGGTSGKSSASGSMVNRYTDTNNQVRHMGIGMVVIVDEDHIPTFLAAFANSRLRIQILQQHWSHTKERIAPQIEETAMANPPAGRRQPGGVAPAAPKAPGGGGRGKLSGMGQAGDGGRGGPPPGVAMPGQGGGIMGGMMGGMAGGKMGLGNLSASTGTETEDDLNLVELAVYGLGSIYERFPAKDKDKDAVVTATPTTPPAAAK